MLGILTFDLSITRKTDLTDEEVIKMIVDSGSPVMVDVLYQRYAHKVYRKCMSFVKDNSIAEDLTHDIFIKMYLNLASFKGKSKFSTWLYSITYNFCIDYIRKNQKSKMVSIEDKIRVVSDMEIETTDDLQHIELKRLEKLLDEMKPEERMILLMKYKDGLSIKEIQKIFSISESAVKMRIKRAKEKVRMLYSQTYAHVDKY